MNIMNQYNATEDESTLGFCYHHLFERAAEECPKRIAAISNDTTIDYHSLNAQANQVAQILVHERKVNRGDIIGIGLHRGIELVIAILAVLKTGAAYVPLDPALPVERLAHMMGNAQPKLVITSDDTIRKPFSPWNSVCLNIDDTRDAISYAESSIILCQDIKPDDLAYIIYTSGSTGKPKGVQANHGALCNLMLSMQSFPGCQPGDRLLAVATISFDMSILDLLLPLSAGATTVIAQTSDLRDPSALVELMERHSVTMIQATPSFFQMLMDGGWCGRPRLRKILTAGEPVSRRQLDRMLEYSDNVYNGYGPTEATVYSSVGLVSRNDEAIVVGRPIANFKLYVLDPDSLESLPLGALGELFIGGVGVNCGYHDNPELTKNRFLDDNPFDGGRLYRSGDLARFIAPDRLTLVGRVDHQVKVRGYRIELGDISSSITAHDSVTAAVTISREDRLIAYYVRKSDHHSNATHHPGASLERSLRSWLAERLPSYMIPDFFVPMDALPLTVNGKVDRNALPDPLSQRHMSAVSNMPKGELEHQISNIWSRILGHDNFDTSDNFFHVGGNSLRVPLLKRELEKSIGRPVQVAKLFEHYSIEALAKYLSMHVPGDTKYSGHHEPYCRLDKVLPPSSTEGQEDIAIIAMSCRLPGGIESPEDYWRFLVHGLSGVTDVPKNRWDADEIYDADPDAPGKSYCRKGAFLSGDVSAFDAAFFGLSPREARMLDPSQRLMLEVCWESFERAGICMQKLRGSSTGVFIGHTNVTAHNDPVDVADLDGYAVTGTIGATLSGRISYVLGLEGPSLTIDTACSSSLVATHLACSALRNRECDVAIAGGVTLMLNPGLHIEFCRLRGMSPDGLCRAFSTDTQGTGFGEGATVIVLKRLSDARQDGDRIQAVLRGSAVNHGGRSAASLTTPSSLAQASLIRKALKDSRLSPEDIDYIEAHGTATKLGDPIEGAALSEVFSGRYPHDDPLWLGSVKSNIGHTQAAAGLAGVIKVVLAMQYGVIPKTLHVSEPTPMIDWTESNIELVLQNRSWKTRAGGLRRAGVSSFGIGGTNAHVMLQQGPDQKEIRNKEGNTLPQASWPFLISGSTDAALLCQVERLRDHVSTNMKETSSAGPVANLAYSLATTRTHFPRRFVFLATNLTGVLDKLNSYMSENGSCTERSSTIQTVHRTAFLFSGQGSQHLQMGAGLASTFPVFRETLESVCSHFKSLSPSLLQVMWSSPDSDKRDLLDRTEYAQPAIFAVQVALWRLWQSWGVQSHTLLGHSVGEIAAVHAAGILDLRDSCRLVSARSRLMQNLASDHKGSMVSIEASPDEVEAAINRFSLRNKVCIAGLNTATQTVISGDCDDVEHLKLYFVEDLARKAKDINVSQAFHSHHMDGMLEPFRAIVEALNFRESSIKVVSSLTGQVAKHGLLQDPGYWTQQLRQAVRFSDAVQTLYNQEHIDTFVEIGATSVLLGMAAACAETLPRESNPDLAFVPSLMTGRMDDCIVIQQALATLHSRYMRINWDIYFASFDCVHIDLPTYAFQRESFRLPQYKSQVTAQADNNRQYQSRNDSEATVRSQYEVRWISSTTSGGQTPQQASMGAFCFAQSATLMEDSKHFLAKSGLRMETVQKVEDASHLDGLLCFLDNRDDSEAPCAALRATTAALEIIQQAITLSSPPSLTWIVRTGAPSIRSIDCPGVGPVSGALSGLLRTAQSEFPYLKIRIIMLAMDQSALAQLPLALKLSEDEAECLVCPRDILVPRLQQLAAQQVSPNIRPMSLRSDGACLITGGLGGIGKQLAKWLASSYGIRDFVLTTRGGMSTPGAAQFQNELARDGVSTTIVACDVAQKESLEKVIRMFDEGRPLRGVFHAAGVVDNGVLSSLTPERVSVTFGPKVYGSWNLHILTQGLNLDVFMMFSSIAGVLGMPGLGNYSAANAYMDALAHLRQWSGLPATAVAYGVWNGEGMASGLTGSTALSHLAQFGLTPFEPQDGLNVLARAVASGRPLTVAAKLEHARLFVHLQGASDDGHTVPPFYRALGNTGVIDAIPKAKSDNIASDGHKDTENGRLSDTLKEVDPERRTSIILRKVQETVARALGHGIVEQVNVDLPLQDIGFDSLTAVLLRNQLAQLTDLKGLSTSSVIWEHENLRALSGFLQSQLELASGASAKLEHECRTSTVQPIKTAESCYLDSAIQFNAFPELDRPNAVLLTGATGFLGAFILYELLELKVITYCLVRADSKQHGEQRLRSVLLSYDLWKPDFTQRLHAVVGNTSKPLLGLDEQTFDTLANAVDSICHSAALVDWMRPLKEYIGPNVHSAHEVLRLASRKQGRAMSVHVISTLATLPLHLGHELDPHEREYGYSMSKYLAERMVEAARWRGAKASVYRVPFVTASSVTGHFRRDQGDFLHNLIAGSLRMRCFPSFGDADLSVVQPVDYLARTISNIMMDDRSRIGHDFDFVNHRAINAAQFFKLLGGGHGEAEVELLPFMDWKQRALDHAIANPRGPLARIVSVLDNLEDEQSAAMMLRSLRTGNNVLGSDLYPAPVVDMTIAQRYAARIHAMEIIETH